MGWGRRHQLGLPWVYGARHRLPWSGLVHAASSPCWEPAVGGDRARAESDLDEGHRASGLCNASAQLVHAVLHGTQDFGLLRLWMTPFVRTGPATRGHGPALESQASPRGRRGVTQERHLCTGGTGSGHDVPRYARGASSTGRRHSQTLRREQAGCVLSARRLWLVGKYKALHGPRCPPIHLRTSFHGQEAENGGRAA